MKTIFTLPNSDNFHLFKECIQHCYPSHQWAIKQSEYLPTIHLKECIVITKNEMPVARAAIYLNPDIEYDGKKTACIGAYECINDEKIADIFHEIIETFCKELGVKFIIGPMNGSTWESYRISIDNTAPLFLTETLSRNYYNDFFIKWGMQSIATYYSSYTHDLENAILQSTALTEHFEEMGLRIRTIDMNHYEAELALMHPFLNEAFQTNFLYSKISKEHFVEKYATFKNYIQQELVLLAIDKNDQIVGLYFCVEDILNKAEKTVIIKTIARNPDKKYTGLGHWMAQQIYQICISKGYQKIIHAFMKESGTSTSVSNKFLGVPFKLYKLYGKQI